MLKVFSNRALFTMIKFAYCHLKPSIQYLITYHIAVSISSILLIAFGCQSNPVNTVLQVGYEDGSEREAVTAPEALTDTVAHSGRRAAQILATADYGPGVTKTWSELDRPQHMRIGGWVWLPHGLVHTALVVVVERNGEAIYYRMLPIHEVVKRYKQWQLVHQTHLLPPNMQDTDQVKIYLWQWKYHYKFYFDDLFVEKLR